MPKVTPAIAAALAVLLGSAQGPAAAGPVPISPAAPGLRSAFDPRSGSWDISWPGRVSRYDLVYLSPPTDPLQGLPLGNGDVGVLFWCEGSRLIAAVNKCDLWDDAAPGGFRNWKKEEEDASTTQRHACRIIIDFQYPVFETLYLSDFAARLNLADATLTLRAGGPFGTVETRAFVDHDSGVLVCELGSDFAEDVPLDISFERLGSRTFSHWYSLITRNVAAGLSGTDAGAAGGRAWITQTVSDGRFAAGGAILRHSGLAVNSTREHSRRSRISLRGGKHKRAELAFTVTSPLAADPLPALNKVLDGARVKGGEALRTAQADAWRAFWLRSFMDCGDDYLNRLWHLTMYYAKASQGGRYPGRFTNGLWGWNRDVQNWNFYFHWNQQQVYWPLNAAGHHDLVAPYLDYRFRSLPQAKKDAGEIFGAPGAWISDVTDRRGANSLSETGNHTPAAEIALDFWRQYEFTGDRRFLGEKALPFILEAARFLASRLVKEPDGLYHAREATGYEGWIVLKDALTELVYARKLLAAALDAAAAAGTSVPEAGAWRDILGACAPLPVIKAGEDSIRRQGTAFRLQKGFFPGRQVPTDEIAVAGRGVEEKEWLTRVDGIFPTVHLSPVFPSGLVGLAQEGSPLFNVMTATVLLYSPEVMGWDPLPIALARLGLAEELDGILARWPERWQIYPNGWGHWGPEAEAKKDAEMPFRTNAVRDAMRTSVDGPFPADKSETFPLPTWPFRYMSMESMSVLATALNESLLQSHDGVLRLAPACPANRTARFTLHAAGGFIVSGEIEAGAPRWAAVKSLSGNPCRLKLPWPRAVAHSSMKKGGRTVAADIVEIKTKPGELVLIVPEGVEPGGWTVVAEAPSRNEEVRRHASGKAQLGLPRMF